MKIRTAKIEDLSALREIYYGSRVNHFTWMNKSLSLLDFDLATAGEEVLLVEDNFEIIAFMSVYEPENFIHLLFVKPGREGQGIGGMLLAELLRNQDRTVRLKCLLQNEGARYFYEKHGFCIVREEVDDQDGPYYVMEKEGH